MEVADDGPNAGEVVGVEGIWGCRSRGMDRRDVVFLGSDIEAPQFGACGVSPSFN